MWKVKNRRKKFIYPNPTADVLYFDSLNGATIKVISSTGELTMQASIERNKVDVNHLAPGVYFIQVYQSTDQIQNAKFIKI